MYRKERCLSRLAALDESSNTEVYIYMYHSKYDNILLSYCTDMGEYCPELEYQMM